MNSKNIDIKENLRLHGLKATHQRVDVLTVLNSTCTHPSAEMIMDTLKQQGIHMSFATVYNVLESFINAGIIHKLTDESGVMHFDSNINFHVHIYDETTATIKDYFDESFCNDMQEYIKKNFDLNGEIVKINLCIQTK